MSSIILVFGMPGSFKTSIAQLLCTRLNSVYFSPSQYGKAHDENGDIIKTLRLQRYILLFKHLQKFINLPINIVIDGCFDIEDVSIELKYFLSENNVKEILFISCISSNICDIMMRIEKRNKSGEFQDFVNPNQPDLIKLCNKNEIIMSFVIENKIPMLGYDSSRKKITYDSCTEEYKLQQITINKIKEILKDNKYIH